MATARGGTSLCGATRRRQAGFLIIESIRNPGELDARARALFRKQAVRIMRNMLGDDSAGPHDAGDLSGTGHARTLFIELRVQAP